MIVVSIVFVTILVIFSISAAIRANTYKSKYTASDGKRTTAEGNYQSAVQALGWNNSFDVAHPSQEWTLCIIDRLKARAGAATAYEASKHKIANAMASHVPETGLLYLNGLPITHDNAAAIHTDAELTKLFISAIESVKALTAENEALKKECEVRSKSQSEQRSKISKLQSELDNQKNLVERERSSVKASTARKDSDIDNLESALERVRKERDTLQAHFDAIENAKPLAVGEKVRHLMGGVTMLITSIDKSHAVTEWWEKNELKTGKFKLSTLSRVSTEKADGNLCAPRGKGSPAFEIRVDGQSVELGPNDSVSITRQSPYGNCEVDYRPNRYTHGTLGSPLITPYW